ICLGAVFLLAGCQSPEKPLDAVSMCIPPRSVLVIPSGSQHEVGGAIGIGPIASGDWVAQRNNTVLGGTPAPIPRFLYAERAMWDVQRANSGRPNGHFRYVTKTRSLAGP
ncbi:MAG: hypothetical protein MK100_09690, partial [Phycisphaerales bacterium]|nr:hypothetical protein [Phycisphaerales bacterium]